MIYDDTINDDACTPLQLRARDAGRVVSAAELLTNALGATHPIAVAALWLESRGRDLTDPEGPLEEALAAGAGVGLDDDEAAFARSNMPEIREALREALTDWGLDGEAWDCAAAMGLREAILSAQYPADGDGAAGTVAHALAWITASGPERYTELALDEALTEAALEVVDGLQCEGSASASQQDVADAWYEAVLLDTDDPPEHGVVRAGEWWLVVHGWLGMSHWATRGEAEAELELGRVGEKESPLWGGP
jgi:hypothetical protein